MEIHYGWGKPFIMKFLKCFKIWSTSKDLSFNLDNIIASILSKAIIISLQFDHNIHQAINLYFQYFGQQN